MARKNHHLKKKSLGMMLMTKKGKPVTIEKDQGFLDRFMDTEKQAEEE